MHPINYVPETIMTASLADIQRDKTRIKCLGLTTLAWLTTQATEQEDAISILVIFDEIERRGAEAVGIFLRECVRLNPWLQVVNAGIQAGGCLGCCGPVEPGDNICAGCFLAVCEPAGEV